MRKWLISLTMVPALALAMPVMAHDHDGNKDDANCGDMKKHHKKGAHHYKMMRGLDLTEAQKTEIKTLKKAFWETHRDEMKASWQMRKEMTRLSYSDAVDQQKLTALIDESAGNHAEFMMARAELNSAVFGVLTAEQQANMQEKMANYQDKKSR